MLPLHFGHKFIGEESFLSMMLFLSSFHLNDLVAQQFELPARVGLCEKSARHRSPESVGNVLACQVQTVLGGEVHLHVGC